MEVRVETRKREVVTAVDEKVYVLTLTEEQARILRAVHGKAHAHAHKLFKFLSPLEEVFPHDWSRNDFFSQLTVIE